MRAFDSWVELATGIIFFFTIIGIGLAIYIAVHFINKFW